MESTARISTVAMFLLVLYCYIHILSVIVEAYRGVTMEAFRDQFTATELLSHKEVLYEEATEEWYAQLHPDEVNREERNSIDLFRQFGHLMKE